ncbi:MAG: hypothetical protein JNM25_17565 [Planctomycetes bacterium]|nr:hypothetical protein [Planctomycetota bacterium]
MKTATAVANARRAQPASPPTAPGAARDSRLAWLPSLLIGVLFAFLLVPRVQQNGHLVQTFAGTAGVLLVWQLVLWLLARRSGHRLAVEFVPPVKQHYIQACVQLCLYAYWGFYWQQPDGVRPIYAQAPLILAQLVFLYAFDALFAWSRGRAWRLASGPMPIVLSTNLFIWFRDDWFVLQFVMVTIGLLGKEFVKWHKEGRRTHVFNPSGFGLAVAAIALIATGNVDLTWAKSLATTIENPPHIFVFLFGLGLVVQGFFAVTLMTFAAAVVMVLINLGYTWTTGVYLFASTNLPAAAFLGLMLLMTDPSTSPRTNLGRTIFGAGYGVGYVVVFQLLGALGAPELFAKLFPVPILNLGVQWLDRLARRGALGRLNTRWETALRPRTTNALHMAAWTAVFLALWGSGYVGGRHHPGDSIPFWKRALAEGRPEAGRKLVMVAGSQAVAGGSAEALNELGILSIEGKVVAADANKALKSAADWFAQAAARGSVHASANILLLDLFLGARSSDQEPRLAFQRLQAEVGNGARGLPCFLVGAAFETAGDGGRAVQYYQRCGPDDLFAAKGIARLALTAAGAAVDVAPVVPRLTAAAANGDAESCWYLAYLHQSGRGVAQDLERAAALRERAAELGFPPAVASRDAPALPPFTRPGWRVLPRPAWATAFPL